MILQRIKLLTQTVHSYKKIQPLFYAKPRLERENISRDLIDKKYKLMDQSPCLVVMGED